MRRRDWQICDSKVPTARDVVVPLPSGAALFFDGLLHHGTPANTTSTRRRALQFHYLRRDAVTTSDDERLLVFGPDPGRVRPRRLRRAVAQVCEQAPCLVWTPPGP